MNPKKVLIIEDSELLHKVYDLILRPMRSHGTSVLFALNGLDGLRKLNEHPDIDLIFLDINMPVMSGLEFLHHCKRENVFQEIPVVIVSTEGSEEDTIRGLKAGAKAYLTKPFTANELLGLVEKVVNAGRPGFPDLAPEMFSKDPTQRMSPLNVSAD